MTTDITVPDTSSTILVLHDPELDPTPFLSRLLDVQLDDDPLRDHIPWTIDNKYYTADVNFRPLPLGVSPLAHPVVMYLFSGKAPDPLPPSLTRLSVLDPPPDLSVAVRIKEGTEPAADTHPTAEDIDEEDRFDEIGMEVVDERGVVDDDDERPLDPLETVRQTLMTHMWPNMVRKGTRGGNVPRPDIIVDAENDGSSDEAHFPVTFSARTPEPRPAGPVSDFPTPPGPTSLDNDDGDDFGDFAPLPDASEFCPIPGADEYSRLESWLDNDGDFPDADGDDEGDDVAAIIAEAMRHIPPGMNGANGANGLSFEDDDDDTAGFEDNFGPLTGARGSMPAIPLDPTPILLHLQQVRAELSQVEDEDERRMRAAAEVERLMSSLGMDGGDWDDDLEEIDGLEQNGNGDEDTLQRLARLDMLDEL